MESYNICSYVWNIILFVSPPALFLDFLDRSLSILLTYSFILFSNLFNFAFILNYSIILISFGLLVLFNIFELDISLIYFHCFCSIDIST